MTYFLLWQADESAASYSGNTRRRGLVKVCSRSLVSYKCEVPECSCLEMQLLSEPKPSEYLEAHLFGSAVPRPFASLAVGPLPFGQKLLVHGIYISVLFHVEANGYRCFIRPVPVF